MNTTYIEPTDEAVAAFLARGIEGPVVMLNLLRFRKVADYSAAPDLAPERPISGAEAYKHYLEIVSPYMGKYGGELIFMGKACPMLIGPDDERWDAGLLARHRSAQAVVTSLRDPAYKALAAHRIAALEDTRILPLLEGTIY
jgi:uncharacterized protein (DUF1330 family)